MSNQNEILSVIKATSKSSCGDASSCAIHSLTSTEPRPSLKRSASKTFMSTLKSASSTLKSASSTLKSVPSSVFRSTSLTRSSSQPVTPTPVHLLQFIFARVPSGRRALFESEKQRAKVRIFPKPSTERTEAFDLAVVQLVRKGDISECRSLLHNQKVSFDACNHFGESLLHMACRRGDVAMVRFLVDEAKVKVDIHDDFGRTPMHDALWTASPNFDVMDILIQSVSPVLLLAEDVRCHTPFHYARREHWKDWVKFLKDRAADIARRLTLLEENLAVKSGGNLSQTMALDTARD